MLENRAYINVFEHFLEEEYIFEASLAKLPNTLSMCPLENSTYYHIRNAVQERLEFETADLFLGDRYRRKTYFRFHDVDALKEEMISAIRNSFR